MTSHTMQRLVCSSESCEFVATARPFEMQDCLVRKWGWPPRLHEPEPRCPCQCPCHLTRHRNKPIEPVLTGEAIRPNVLVRFCLKKPPRRPGLSQAPGVALTSATCGRHRGSACRFARPPSTSFIRSRARQCIGASAAFNQWPRRQLDPFTRDRLF